MRLAQTPVPRLVCWALDHHPQITTDQRSGASFIICERCHRFLGLAGAAGRIEPATPRGLTAAMRFAAAVKVGSAR